MVLQKRLKSKLELVVVTRSSIEYGSVTIDENLMDAMGIQEYDAVEINGVTTKARITSYVIKGERDSGIIGINGGASLHFKVGDKVHVLCYHYSPNKTQPLIIITEGNNKLIKLKNEYRTSIS